MFFGNEQLFFKGAIEGTTSFWKNYQLLVEPLLFQGITICLLLLQRLLFLQVTLNLNTDIPKYHRTINPKTPTKWNPAQLPFLEVKYVLTEYTLSKGPNIFFANQGGLTFVLRKYKCNENCGLYHKTGQYVRSRSLPWPQWSPESRGEEGVATATRAGTELGTVYKNRARQSSLFLWLI